MADLNEIAVKLFEARRIEENAKAERIACEEEIAKLVETEANGSKTVRAGDIKITVKRELAYVANVDAIRELDIPEAFLPIKIIPPVPIGYEFDRKKYDALREDNPIAYATVSGLVTTKPKKVSVTLALA